MVPFFDEDYYDSLLAEIREIRLSGRRFYQKITDIYATSMNYDKKSPTTIKYFKKVQNKMHYAVSHQTATEIIYNRADSEKENIGLTSWKNSPNGKILETDVVIAKNYLSKEEFDKVQNILNRQTKVNKDGSIDILSGFLKCKCCNNVMIKRKSKDKIYYYCSNYYRNKICENDKSISENGLIEIIKEKLNLTDITRLELENKVKYIYIDKNKNVKIDFK